MEDIFKGLGVEIELAQPDDFLKVKETLTRIGVASKVDNKLYQSCHILHKRGRYAILHFKEMFIFDGKENNVTEDDVLRRNAIVKLLSEWKLVKANGASDLPSSTLSHIKVVAHRDRGDWELCPKYSIGNVRNSNTKPKS